VSGILGILNFDDQPVDAEDLSSMASVLARRGPDRTSLWRLGSVGLGHTLLTTTPELAFERQPFEHHASGCVVAADVRLDNRDELIGALRLRESVGEIGDARLIVEAYLAWGEDCPARLLGDFAFAIWDPKRRSVFCARDCFGLRPFCYFHRAGRMFAWASEPRALLALPQVPLRINEGRVADYLVSELQWIDYTSTFFCDIQRLPPAHALTVTADRVHVRPYWRLKPGPELKLAGNEAYADAMRSVLTQAVQSRLRSSGRVGSMLSGGLDSSSVVATARDLPRSHAGPFDTFSGVDPVPENCPETRSILAVCAMGGLAPHLIDYSALQALQPQLEDASWSLDEPFDVTMALVRSMYLSAQKSVVRVVMDGAGSDVVLNDGTYIIRQFRQGHWKTAWQEASGLDRFYGRGRSLNGPLRRVRAALTPAAVRRWALRAHHPLRTAASMRRAWINPEFARRVSLPDRLRTLDKTFQRGWFADYRDESAAALHPNLTAGRERYDRAAARWGVEPRDPYLDRRVVEFCVTLPGAQRLDQGWPKPILRRAMKGRLPDSVLWRPGKPHLGWRFVAAVTEARLQAMGRHPGTVLETVGPFMDLSAVREAWRAYFAGGNASHREPVLAAMNLAVWLQGAAKRPPRSGL
jgi:asparagine synthase (glutamine-hydrolysing)